MENKTCLWFSLWCSGFKASFSMAVPCFIWGLAPVPRCASAECHVMSHSPQGEGYKREGVTGIKVTCCLWSVTSFSTCWWTSDVRHIQLVVAQYFTWILILDCIYYWNLFCFLYCFVFLFLFLLDLFILFYVYQYFACRYGFGHMLVSEEVRRGHKIPWMVTDDGEPSWGC